MATANILPFNNDTVDRLTQRLTKHHRILLWGPMGVGKSTLAMKLLQSLSQSGGRCQMLELDPGTPPFGVPGTISRGWCKGTQWLWRDCQPLCTFDAARFRLPLILAARRLMTVAENEDQVGLILIDPPGVARGVGGAELLIALSEILNIDAVVALSREGAPLPLAEELASLPVEIFSVAAAPEARLLSRTARTKHRTMLWDRFLSTSTEETFMLNHLRVMGTPPPREIPEAWKGRQAALLDATGKMTRMGEILQLQQEELSIRTVPGGIAQPVALLIRDAGRNAAGKFETVAHVGRPSAARREPVEMTSPAFSLKAWDKPVSSHLGPAWATLVGGVFGDPLLHVRLRNLKQSFLFDLGNPARLAGKVAHQVRAVFLSHAHLDHIGGFIWFLRSRLVPVGPCKIFGPLDTIRRIESFLNGITWDRINDTGPVFEVCEISASSIRRAMLQPGKPRIELPEISAEDGVILTQESFTIKAVVCDHNTPSVAYALVFRQEVNVRKERLTASGLPPGPWLGRLKHCIAADTPEAEIELPNGTLRRAGELAEELTIIRPGRKLVYAADMADTPENRKTLIDFAQSAHTLFCETAFTMADKEKADATQHLTTLAAVHIAREAGVQRLVPFHFSKRYERNPRLIYDEILAAAGPVQILGNL